jgi:hypothetical protein
MKKAARRARARESDCDDDELVVGRPNQRELDAREVGVVTMHIRSYTNPFVVFWSEAAECRAANNVFITLN